MSADKGLDRRAVIEVLKTHRIHYAYGLQAACVCGGHLFVPAMGGDPHDSTWAEHVADAVLATAVDLREVKAEALEEARDAWGSDNSDEDDPMYGFLTRRAQSIREAGAGQ